MPVYNTVNYLEPTATIPYAFNSSGTGSQVVTLPSIFNGRAWRVTSVVCTAAASTATASLQIVLYGGVAGGTAGIAEVTLTTRRFVIGTAPVQLKVKQARRVQHAVADGVNVVNFVFGTNSGICDGVINFSVRGPV